MKPQCGKPESLEMKMLVPLTLLLAGLLSSPPLLAEEMADAPAERATPKSAVAPDGEIDWLALMPPEDIKALEALPEIGHSGAGPEVVFSSEKVVAAMDGVKGKLGGYIVPLETDARGQMLDFFLVPYFGACIHMPPPPPNQIVYVKPEKPLPMTEIWDAYWVHGTLRTRRQQNEVATAVYSMELERIELVQ